MKSKAESWVGLRRNMATLLHRKGDEICPFGAWCWLITQAMWVSRKPDVGVLDFSYSELASAWSWSRSRVVRFLKHLESLGYVSRPSENPKLDLVRERHSNRNAKWNVYLEPNQDVIQQLEMFDGPPCEHEPERPIYKDLIDHRSNTLTKELQPVPDSEEVKFPPELDTPECRAAWAEYINVRLAKKKPLTVRSQNLEIAHWVSAGPERFCGAVLFTARKGWDGIVEEGAYAASNGKSTASVVRATARRERDAESVLKAAADTARDRELTAHLIGMATRKPQEAIKR